MTNFLRLTIIFLLLLTMNHELFSKQTTGEIFFNGQKIQLDITNTDRAEINNICEHSMPKKICQSSQFSRKESPVTVEVHDFRFDIAPVTVGLYNAYLVETNQSFPLKNFNDKERADFPMTGVTWDEAIAYCEHQGKRLPTKNEYLIAMYDGNIFPYDRYKDCNVSKFWMPLKLRKKIYDLEPICQKRNMGQQGICDLYGNVSEWTSDQYDPHTNWSNFDYGNEGAEKYYNSLRVVKTASFFSYPYQLNIFEEISAPHDERYYTIGFRCAEDAVETK